VFASRSGKDFLNSSRKWPAISHTQVIRCHDVLLKVLILNFKRRLMISLSYLCLCVAPWFLKGRSQVQLLLIFTSTAILSFGSRRDPWQNLYSFARPFTGLEMGSPLRRKEELLCEFLGMLHICYTVISHWCTRTPERLTAKLLLVFASTVMLGSESRGTHGLILPSGGSGSLPDLLLKDESCHVYTTSSPTARKTPAATVPLLFPYLFTFVSSVI
jgi:hypothetical protein